MTMFTWRNYKPGDERYFNCRLLPKRGTDEWNTFVKNCETRNATTFALIDEDGTVRGVAGLVQWLPGNCEAWSAVNDDTLRLKDMPKAVRELLDYLQETLRIPRVWAVADPDEIDVLDGWLIYQGFEFEALIRRWGPAGNDQYFYARVREWA